MEQQTRNQMLRIMTSVKNGLIYFQKTNQYIIIKKCIAALRSIDKLCTTSFSPKRAKYYNDAIKLVILKLSHLQEGQSALNFSGNALIKSLDIISDQLKHEREIKKEIIFLPYKASMWDSLESIWQAAVEDKEHCDTYVIPIPYCDRNPDGTPAQWHYEADQFPSYVPITDFKKYNLAEHRPDVIFIHNPYDGYNRVTSVDSKYYSSELKKYTDMLVYIPYFVSGPSVSDSICKVPGIVIADHVIVESEQIKKQYEAYYPCGNPPKNKFLALGSPKFDKVLNSRRENFILPKNWKRIINGKKIILYNTSLGAALENSDKVNVKLRYVFSIFKNRKDVALWWRPHPLMKATLESMRPEILYEYQQLEQSYKTEGWGIYDDTADLHRAIAWSDTYYGDMSSVVWLYKITGKPIMIQDMYINKITNIGFRFDYIFPEKDNIWFISQGTFCALYRLNLLTNELECLGELPTQYRTRFEYIVLVKIDNKIIIAPYYTGYNFIEYDILQNKFITTYCMKQILDKYACNNTPLFTDAIIYKQSVFFISNILIVEYNRITCQYIYHKNWLKDSLKELQEKDIIFPLYGHVQTNNVVYLAIFKSNYILRLDLDTFEINLLSVPIKIKTISYGKHFFWITPYYGNKIIKWSLTDNTYKEIILPIEEHSILAFSNIIKYEYGWLIIPYIKCHSIFMLKDDTYNYKIDIQVDNQRFPQYTFAMIDQGQQRSFAFNYGTNTLEEFNYITGKIIKHKIILPTDKIKEYVQSNAYMKNSLIYEGNFLDLSSYIVLEKKINLIMHRHFSSGKNILLYCLS